MLKSLLAILFVAASSAAAQTPGWSAHWISPAAPRPNQWMLFRKSITLSDVPPTARVRVAADTKYWLYVNGSLVVFEGGLKGGPNPKDSFYDEVDLAPFLRTGVNTVAALVWYYGKNGYSYKNRGVDGGAFLLQGEFAGSSALSTDSTWKSIVHPGYGADLTGTQPNKRLSESNVVFDARAAAPIDGWQSENFNDRLLTNALDRGPVGTPPWNALVPRPIPLFRFSELRTYTSVVTTSTSRGRRIVGQLPTNLQITPYLIVDAPAGASISIQTDHYDDGKDSNVRSTYIARGGVQEFESLGWMSGTAVQYDMPSSVRVTAVGYRESGYATDFVGSFESSDARLDQLWRKAARTVYVNMRDSYMDCPTRERAQWWADAVTEIRSGAYVFDTASHQLGAKAIGDLVHWRRPTGELNSPSPAGLPVAELPQQMLASVWGTWQYYLLTGDSAWMRDSYVAFRDYLNFWAPDPASPALVIHRAGEWDWSDWGDNIDSRLLETAWYLLAAQTVANIAHTVGRVDEEAAWRRRVENMGADLDGLWDSSEGVYRSPGYRGPPDERGSALLVLAGVVPEARYGAVTQSLFTRRNASPYLEVYVLEALYKLGAPGAAISRMLSRYGPEIAGPDAGPTLWEFWNPNSGTTNHGWSAGPLALLSGYAAGVRPIDPGYSRYIVDPQLGTLTRAHAVVPTRYGTIESETKVDGIRHRETTLRSPSGTEARMMIPWPSTSQGLLSINGVPVFRNGTTIGAVKGASAISADTKSLWLDLEPGTWTFTSDFEVAPIVPHPALPPDSPRLE